jgi:hypothetical protein
MERKHTLNSPLKLTWDGHEYKVNKSNVEGGEFVSKEIAKDLLEALYSVLADPQRLNGAAMAYSIGKKFPLTENVKIEADFYESILNTIKKATK